jgi:hypothetical protein
LFEQSLLPGGGLIQITKEKPMTQEKLTEHYKLIDTGPTNQSHVELMKTPYEGVVYAYGNLKFETVRGEPVVSYMFEVLKNQNNLYLDNDRNFKELINTILDELLVNTFCLSPSGT